MRWPPWHGEWVRLGGEDVVGQGNGVVGVLQQIEVLDRLRQPERLLRGPKANSEGVRQRCCSRRNRGWAHGGTPPGTCPWWVYLAVVKRQNGKTAKRRVRSSLPCQARTSPCCGTKVLSARFRAHTHTRRSQTQQQWLCQATDTRSPPGLFVVVAAAAGRARRVDIRVCTVAVRGLASVAGWWWRW